MSLSIKSLFFVSALLFSAACAADVDASGSDTSSEDDLKSMKVIPTGHYSASQITEGGMRLFEIFQGKVAEMGTGKFTKGVYAIDMTTVEGIFFPSVDRIEGDVTAYSRINSKKGEFTVQIRPWTSPIDKKAMQPGEGVMASFTLESLDSIGLNYKITNKSTGKSSNVTRH